jgi:hypothetical protein
MCASDAGGGIVNKADTVFHCVAARRVVRFNLISHSLLAWASGAE